MSPPRELAFEYALKHPVKKNIMLSTEQIEQLERLRKQPARNPEEEALVQLIAENSQLAADAQQYEMLWSGFDVLQSQHTENQIEKWNVECAENDDNELAEWYIHQQLGSERQQLVKERITIDRKFAALVDDHSNLLGGFEVAGDEDFGKRLKQWNQETPATQPARVVSMRSRIFRRLASAAAVLLLVFAGGNWYASQNYSNMALAISSSKFSSSSVSLGSGTNTPSGFVADVNAASDLLSNSKFELAERDFSALQAGILTAGLNDEDIIYYSERIEWNLLLAQLGADHTDGTFAQRLSAIAENDQHEFHENAITLRKKLSSFWRMF